MWQTGSTRGSKMTLRSARHRCLFEPEAPLRDSYIAERRGLPLPACGERSARASAPARRVRVPRRESERQERVSETQTRETAPSPRPSPRTRGEGAGPRLRASEQMLNTVGSPRTTPRSPRCSACQPAPCRPRGLNPRNSLHFLPQSGGRDRRRSCPPLGCRRQRQGTSSTGGEPTEGDQEPNSAVTRLAPSHATQYSRSVTKIVDSNQSPPLRRYGRVR
jgi:hypothetical protein